MLFWQDEKDALKQELFTIKRNIDFLRSDMNRQFALVNERVDALTQPYGIKKDGTPKAKPGRKPK
jgi:hypothetical protein